MQNDNSKFKINELKNLKIAVLGYGVNNAGLVDWLVKHGASNISILDRNVKLKIKNLKLKIKLGKNYLDNLDKFDIIFRTPGLPYLSKEIQDAKKKGVKIYSQTKLFFDLCPAKIIGITGTKGKGTTASLIFNILKSDLPAGKAGIRNLKSEVYLAGNFGKDPFEFLDQLKKSDFVVMELSSFQLQDLHKNPFISVILPITPDHFNHHKNMAEYIAAKANIVSHQSKSDYSVLCRDDKNNRLLEKVAGGKIVWFSKNDNTQSRFPTRLLGEHNRQNINAAVKVAKILKIKDEIIKEGIEKFQPLPHRLEFVKDIKGVRYFDDSFATTPEATVASLQTFSQPIILLCGGSSKNADYAELGRVIGEKCKAVIACGQTAAKIIDAIPKNQPAVNTYHKKDLHSSFAIAKDICQPGDIILLSPASASFDQFKNASERGDYFKKMVNEIK